jgi:hypothetical protein
VSTIFLQELFSNTSTKLPWPPSPEGFSVEVGVAHRTRPRRDSRYVVSIERSERARLRDGYFEISGYVFTKYEDGRITSQRNTYTVVDSKSDKERLTEELNYVIWCMRGVCSRAIDHENRARRKGMF